MASRSSTPLSDDLYQEMIDRLFKAAPFEYLILKGHLLIEQVLDVLIDSALRPGILRKDFGYLTFAFKLALARALGVLPDIYVGPITSLNNVRNKLAHLGRNKLAHKGGYRITVSDLQAILPDDDDANIAETIRSDFVSNPTDTTMNVIGSLVLKCLALVSDHELKVHRDGSPL